MTGTTGRAIIRLHPPHIGVVMSLVMVPPVVPIRGTRSIDASGGGGYGAPRRKKCANLAPTCYNCKGTGWQHYAHFGLDFIAEVGDDIIQSFPAKIYKLGRAYADGNLRSIHYEGINDFNGYRAKLLYAEPVSGIEVGSEREAGIVIASAQDVVAYHAAQGKMTNHVHFELFHNGERIDPTAFFIY